MRLVQIVLTVTTDLPAAEVTAAIDNLKGRSLPGLPGATIWQAHSVEPSGTIAATAATSLAPIPGIVKTAHIPQTGGSPLTDDEEEPDDYADM